jgi:hypothetical protein
MIGFLCNYVAMFQWRGQSSPMQQTIFKYPWQDKTPNQRTPKHKKRNVAQRFA